MTRMLLWAPGVVLALGAVFCVGIEGQRSMELRAPLDHSIPRVISGQQSRDLEISKAERTVAGMSSYVMRVYSPSGQTADQIQAAFSVYVGYYPEQMRGKSIHSPKNCLPGSGWEALTSQPVAVKTPNGVVTVNQYVLQRGQQRAVVLYWYQGRGRVEANEYVVKWNLLRDAAVKRRSDEALVRVVVPAASQGDAFLTASQIAGLLVPAVANALPEG